MTVTAACPGATATEFSAVSGNDKSKLFTSRKPARRADVAADAWSAMKRGRVLAIQGALNQVLAVASKLSPRSMATGIAASLNKH